MNAESVHGSATGLRSPDDVVPPVLEIHNLSKRFGGVHALKGVGLTVRSTQIHGLLGQNCQRRRLRPGAQHP